MHGNQLGRIHPEAIPPTSRERARSGRSIEVEPVRCRILAGLPARGHAARRKRRPRPGQREPASARGGMDRRLPMLRRGTTGSGATERTFEHSPDSAPAPADHLSRRQLRMMVRTQRMPERWHGHWSGLRQKSRKPHSGRCDDGSWRFARPAFGPGIRTGGQGGRKGEVGHLGAGGTRRDLPDAGDPRTFCGGGE